MLPGDSPVTTSQVANPRILSQSTILALVDQIVVSGGRFAVTILIGRISGVASLGLYGMIFALFILIASVQESLLTKPFTVLGASLQEQERRFYAGSILLQAGLVSFLAGLVVALAGGWVISGGLGPRRTGAIAFAAGSLSAFPASVASGTRSTAGPWKYSRCAPAGSTHHAFRSYRTSTAGLLE